VWLRITKREIFERLGLEVFDDLLEPRTAFMVEAGTHEITVTVSVFRRDDDGRMCAQIFENYYSDVAWKLAERKCLFYLDLIEMSLDYVGFKKMAICGEAINLHDRRELGEGLDQFRVALRDVEAEKRPVFVPPSVKEKARNVLEEPRGIIIGGGKNGHGTLYHP